MENPQRSQAVKEKFMKAKEFIPASKPRNFVAKNQKTAGAGAHRDKKKEQKQGYEKHKGQGVAEGMFGIDSKTKGAIQNVVSQLSDIPGMWDHAAQTFTPEGLEKLKSLLKDNPKHIKYAVNLKADDYDESIEMERVRDPEDWDEGNTEPGNNFAVYINGKKWKVFPGPAGAYADSPEEKREFQRLKDMAARKSAATGKKWEIYITGEPATK
jgi:hypothetical protein